LPPRLILMFLICQQQNTAALTLVGREVIDFPESVDRGDFTKPWELLN